MLDLLGFLFVTLAQLANLHHFCRRVRVKRKRAEAKKEAKTESIRAAAEQHKGKPDLSELSKGFPSGWQVSIFTWFHTLDFFLLY